MSYRGPQPTRHAQQFSGVMGHAGETATWVRYVSAAARTSAYYAGGGLTQYSACQTITGLFAAPQAGETRFRETQLPGGQVMAGDLLMSTERPLGVQDEVQWRGVVYRVEGDAVPIHIGARLWYRTVLRRGDATG